MGICVDYFMVSKDQLMSAVLPIFLHYASATVTQILNVTHI